MGYCRKPSEPASPRPVAWQYPALGHIGALCCAGRRPKVVRCTRRLLAVIGFWTRQTSSGHRRGKDP